MKRVTAFKSDDGTIHENEEDATKADLQYWKKRAQEAEKKVPVERYEHRQPYAEKEERGGHQ